MVNMQNCNSVVSEFKIQSRHNIYFRTNTFRKGMNFP